MPIDFTPCTSCRSPMACRDVATCRQSAAPNRGPLTETPVPGVHAYHNRRYTQAELEEAFDRVKPSPHWKARIHCEVTVTRVGELDLIRDAVIYFTGSLPEFRLLRVLQDFSEVHQVTAAGYWETIGA